MGTVTYFLLCSFVVVVAQNEVTLGADRPFLAVQHSLTAHLECCFTTTKDLGKLRWIKRTAIDSVVNISDPLPHKLSNEWCGHLTIESVQLNQSGMYHCLINLTESSHLRTHGTYLHVYKPLEKTINLGERTKNKILIAEGILLLLCVMLPSATLLCQSRRLNELEKKKAKKEEENIYQGLNLDDCCSTYDQIERSQGLGPYQDVGTIMEEDMIQLEKP